jgi:hypothetical protein
MDTGGEEAHEALVDFLPQRVLFSMRAQVAAPYLPLISNAPVVYGCLLDALRNFAISVNDLRIDAGDGTLGGYRVEFWAPQGRYRIHLMGVDVEQLERTPPVQLPKVDQLTCSVLGALVQSQPGTVFESYRVEYALHGVPCGIAPAQFVGRFTGDTPEGLGPCTPAGAFFNFGADGSRLSCSISVERSEFLSDLVFIRSVALFDGGMPQSALGVVSTQFLDMTLASIGLRLVLSPGLKQEG